MLLSIIIVSYNTAELTLSALKAVEKSVLASPQLSGKTEVIVVDNHSSDESVKVIAQYFQELNETQSQKIHTQLIAHTTNAGFAVANNLGMKRATGQYFLLLNSDTVVQKDAIDQLVNSFLSHPIQDATSALARTSGQLDRVGIVAATLQNKDGSWQPQGGSLPSLVTVAVQMLLLDDLPVVGQWLPSTQQTHRRTSSDSLLTSGWVGGTAMMIRRELTDEIGMLDENIFMYGEDVEFCWRAQNHQWDVALCPAAVVTHFGSASSSSANAIMGEFKAYLYLWSKYQPNWQLPILKLVLTIGAHLRIFLFGTMGKNKARAKVYTLLLSELF